MKVVYILMLLVVAASSLGCMGQKQQESTDAPPVDTSDQPDVGSENDEFGIEADLAEMDSMFNDSSLDLSLEVNEVFT